MAKQKSEPYPSQAKLDAAKKHLETAKQKAEKQDTDANKKAVNEQQEIVSSLKKAVNRERFLRIGNARAAKAVAAINNLAKVANKNQYAFTTDDVVKMSEVLNDAVKNVVSSFNAALSGTTATATETKPLFE